jgi:hypothetical protein
MRIFLLLLATATLVRADVGSTNVPADTILARVLANRPMKDFSLKARLFVTRELVVPINVLVKNSATEARTVYRSDKTQLLVVQPAHGAPRYYRQGVGELTGDQQLGKLLDSQFTFYDLGTPFLQWPNPKMVGDERMRGRDCFLIDVRATNQPYAHVKMWIDKEYTALLRADAFNENDSPVKRLAVTSFMRIGDVWIPRAIECASVPPGQTLPAEERSRLEIFEGNYDAQLPPDWFSPGCFGPTAR